MTGKVLPAYHRKSIAEKVRHVILRVKVFDMRIERRIVAALLAATMVIAADDCFAQIINGTAVSSTDTLGITLGRLKFIIDPVTGRAELRFEYDTNFPTASLAPGANPVLFPEDGVLTENERLTILRAHAVAQQQIDVALAYLATNAERILTGNDAWYNQIFGHYYDDTAANPEIGTYIQTLEHYELIVGVFENLRHAFETPVSYEAARANEDRVLAVLGQVGTVPDDPEVPGFDPFSLGVRMFGFSNSGSETQVQSIQDAILASVITDGVTLADLLDDNPLTGFTPIFWVDEDYDELLRQLTVVPEPLPARDAEGLLLDPDSRPGTMYVGEAFFTELQAAGGIFDTSAPDILVPAPDDYQQLIAAYAEILAYEALVIGDDFPIVGIRETINIELLEAATEDGAEVESILTQLRIFDLIFGANAADFFAYSSIPFPQVSDVGSYAAFLDVDGPLGALAAGLPPAGKAGTTNNDPLGIVGDTIDTIAPTIDDEGAIDATGNGGGSAPVVVPET